MSAIEKLIEHMEKTLVGTHFNGKHIDAIEYQYAPSRDAHFLVISYTDRHGDLIEFSFTLTDQVVNSGY